jgi:hypothetical protein
LQPKATPVVAKAKKARWSSRSSLLAGTRRLHLLLFDPSLHPLLQQISGIAPPPQHVRREFRDQKTRKGEEPVSCLKARPLLRIRYGLALNF